MACVVCQHCQGRFLKDDSIAVREGFSYHKKCHKCYVCSETNLHNAEVFKGVIFCSSCSQRIFQGCSTAKKNKNGNRSLSSRPKPRMKRRERPHHLQERRVESAKPHHTSGVIELTRLAVSTESDSSHLEKKTSHILSNPLAFSNEEDLQIAKKISDDNSKSLKKESIEMGMTTEVTQELLRQMNCPVVAERRKGSRSASPKFHATDKGDSKFLSNIKLNKTIICSDLRIAELGASTEIAHMALRKRSEVPVIIKSESGTKANESSTLSGLDQISDTSGDGNAEWLDSTFHAEEKGNKSWLDRRIGSILKIPYNCFKKNILNRSSLISVLINERESRIFTKKLKLLFNKKCVEHQEHGVKRLYSTINRRKIPYKLGWLTPVEKVSLGLKPNLAITDGHEPTLRRKHLSRSHSYWCMRAQAMRLAGPTKSQLFEIRHKMKKLVIPKFLKDIINFNNKYPALMMSQGCGSAVHVSSTQHLTKIK